MVVILTACDRNVDVKAIRSCLAGNNFGHFLCLPSKSCDLDDCSGVLKVNIIFI